MSENSKTWAAFWSENKPLVWFITISLIAMLGYLIYNNWEITTTSLKPPSEKEVKSPHEPTKVEGQIPEKPKEKEIKPISESQAPPLTNQQGSTKSLIKILLIVDAEFEKGAIFVNDKQVYPVKETPTMKYLEIEYQPNIWIEVKSRNQTCAVKKSITKSELNHQIQLTCIQ
jgi:hypothetical protein